MNHSEYRPDIDGLRAVAVLCVILFHLDIKLFSGGYIGVDVFFVISGFLITRLIRREVLETGSFSLSNFYLRRARRILPALFLTLALTLVAGFFLFSPEHFQRLGGASLHAVMSVSNFFFWGESGYFDTEAVYKPLLHTWSLGVEEQFYLAWPMVLAFLLLKLPKLATPMFLLCAAIVSFSLNLLVVGPALLQHFPLVAGLVSDGPSTIFYLAPFRVFEFAIGAILVWVVQFQPNRTTWLEPVVPIGLGMILYPALMYSADTIFPSTNAFLPCTGAALVIYGGTARYSGRLLNNPLVVPIGLISYSLYLVHWPLIVYYRYYTQTELTWPDRAALSALAMVAAALMYRYVEQRFRRRERSAYALLPGNFGVASAIIALLITFPSASAWANKGWAWRFGSGETIAMFTERDNFLIERARWLEAHMTPVFTRRVGTKNILAIGDSYAADMTMALALNLDDKFDVQSLALPIDCFPHLAGKDEDPTERCQQVRLLIERGPKLQAADQIIVSYRYPVTNFKAQQMRPLLDLLEKKKKPAAKIFVFDRGPSFERLQQAAVAILSEGRGREAVEKKARELSGEWANPKEELEQAAEANGYQFVSKYDIFCSDVKCSFFTDNGTLMFWDVAHLTVDGARWFGARVLKRIGPL